MDFLRNILAIPFGYALSFLYLLTGNYILSIVCLTVVVRACMLPVSIKQQKNSAKQVRLQPKISKIRQKYQGNQQKIGEETQALYQREGFSVTQGGCMPLLIQFPIMIGLYGVIYTPLTNVLRIASTKVETLTAAFKTFAETAGITYQEHSVEITMLKHFDDFKAAVSSVTSTLTGDELKSIVDFNNKFNIFGINLSDTPSFKVFDALWLIPILAGISAMGTAVFMFIKQRQQNPEMAKNPAMGCMTFFSPLMSVYFTFLFPAGVGFYWIVSNIISFIQTVALSIIYSPKKVIAQQMVEETIQRRARECNVKKRIEIESK